MLAQDKIKILAARVQLINMLLKQGAALGPSEREKLEKQRAEYVKILEASNAVSILS